MYKIKIYSPGKTKSKFIKEGLSHYLKLITPFAKVDIIEIKEGHGESEKVIAEESKNIINAVEGEFILLDREGMLIDSLQFSQLLRNKSIHQFVIGGVYGVNNTVKEACSLKLSFSKLTFPHELCRLLLLEQLYRAMTIIHGKKYHY